MTFDVPADAYARFMGVYSEKLAVEFADAAGVTAGLRALDVGCGPGALTAVLVDRLGSDHVAALDPSEPFVEAARTRLPGVDIRLASAERIPFDDDIFDLALAELVVQFMSDRVAGVTEMARATKPGGTVAACVWDHGGGRGALSSFWSVARALDARLDGESRQFGAHAGQLAQLFEQVGLRDVRSMLLTVHRDYGSFEEWWEPFTWGVGPAGVYVAGLDDPARERLREACVASLPGGPFTIDASAWTAVGTV